MGRAILVDFEHDGHPVAGAALLQGAQCAIAFRRRRERKAFSEALLLGAAPATGEPARFAAGAWQCRRHLPAARFALVSHAPHLFARMSVADNLALADSGRPGFAARVRRCLFETGLLAGFDPRQPAGSLPWTGQVELNFVQAWLREPECLVFDHVFDHDDSAALLRLPALFRARYPLRAICHLEQAGRLATPLGITHVIDIA